MVGFNVLAKEAEGWLGVVPISLLKLARRRVPPHLRDDLYEEWSAELYEAIHGTEERPVSRLILGVRFAGGLLWTAGRIGKTLDGIRETSSISIKESNGSVPTAEILSLTGSAAFVSPRTFSDARGIGESYRSGKRVVLDLNHISERDAKRLIDFAAGLAFALRGHFDRAGTRLFVLSPARTEPTETLHGVHH